MYTNPDRRLTGESQSNSTNDTISVAENVNQGEDSLLEMEVLGNAFETCKLDGRSVSPDADSSAAESEPTEREPTESEPTESEPTESSSSSGSDSNAEDLGQSPLEHMHSISLPTMILGQRGQRLEQDILCFFERLVDKQMGIVQHQGGQQSRQSPRDIGSTREESSSNPTCSSSGSSRKRGISNGRDDEDNTGGDDRGNAGRNRKVPRLGEPAQQKIACPFMKRHPVEFSTWRTCLGPGFSDINRMKEHLKRRHYREHSCGRCGEHFQKNIELQQHMRAREPCPLREIETAMGFITQLQWNEVSVKKRGAILDRWKEIYTILFPEVEESQIPGPYHDVSETADQLRRMINCDEFEAHMRTDLPRRVLAQLNREFQIMAEHARQRVAEIAQEQSVATMAAYLQERGLNAAENAGVDLGIVDDLFPFDFGLLDQSDIFTGDVGAPPLGVSNEEGGFQDIGRQSWPNG
ncbi:hypothetical protein DL771_005502 [Monosporascus sp. 5C6A]|nr:hypothetical protein DL771_005502 [Monosporascus sp. 5C6A]